MSQFAILRTQKIKSKGALKRSKKHNFREQPTPNADPFLEAKNEVWGDPIANFEQKVKGLKIRKNAVLAVEVVMTFSPDTKILSIEAWKNQNLKWLKRNFGEDNLLDYSLHLDEKTPHLHAHIIPIDPKGKLNCRHFLGGREALTRLQDSYAKAMEPFGLERGVKRSRATHTDIKEYYGKIELAKQELAEAKAERQAADEIKGLITNLYNKIVDHINRWTKAVVAKNEKAAKVEEEAIRRQAQAFKQVSPESIQAALERRRKAAEAKTGRSLKL